MSERKVGDVITGTEASEITCKGGKVRDVYHNACRWIIRVRKLRESHGN